MEEATPKTLRKRFNEDKLMLDSAIGTDLERELATNPSNLAYYSAQAAYWQRESDRLKALKDVLWSQAFKDAQGDGGKSPPVEMRKAIAETNQEFQNTNDLWLEAKEQHKLYEHAVDIMSQKQFSLGSLNSREKREIDISTGVSSGRRTSEDKAATRASIMDALYKSKGSES